GRADTAIVLRKGSEAELGSVIDAAEVNRILGAPGVRKDGQSRPVGAGETVVVNAMDKLGTQGGVSNVQLRGITEASRELRPEVRIVEGRAARPGSSEVIVGARIRGAFRGLDLGQTFELRKNRPAQVVGVFEANGSSNESEVWVDLDTLRAAYAFEGAVSTVRVKLTSEAAFDGFKGSMEGDRAFG